LFKSGFIGIIGRPNVGKSTFLNAVVGDKISIVADKPQTTRDKITGIKNFPDAQLIFIDTPGMHNPKTPLNRAMVQTAQKAIGDAEMLLMLIEANADVRRSKCLFFWLSIKLTLSKRNFFCLLLINSALFTTTGKFFRFPR